MKKRTVMGHLYAATRDLDQAVLAAARSDEVSDRQRERVAFAVRLTESIVEDLKRKTK